MTDAEAAEAQRELEKWAERRKRERWLTACALVSYPLGTFGPTEDPVYGWGGWGEARRAAWRIDMLKAGAAALNAA